MDVRCEKCQTEYELDESRLKPGGVTVKCTNCGHMFKIRKRTPTNVGVPSGEEPRTRPVSSKPPMNMARPGSEDEAPTVRAPTNDLGSGPTEARQWLIRLESGETKSCRELATLQQWIVAGIVTRESLISRSGKTWKRLGDIPELGQYFVIADEARQKRSRQPTPKPMVAATMLGVGPTAAGGTVLDEDEQRTTGNFRSRPKTNPPHPPPKSQSQPRANPMAQTELSIPEPPTTRRPPTQPPPMPQRPGGSKPPGLASPPAGQRQTAAWASSEIKQTDSLAAMPQGPRSGKLSAIPDEPAFAGRVRVQPSEESSFDTARVQKYDEDDDMLPGRTGSRAGMWIVLLALVVIGCAALATYMFVFRQKKNEQAQKPIDAAPVAAVVADAAQMAQAVDAAPPPPSPIDTARNELGGGAETKLRAALAGLQASATTDDPNALALRALLGTAIAQSELDRAGLILDRAESDKLRKDAKQLVVEAAPLAQKAQKAAPDDPTANLAFADALRLQGKPAREVRRYLDAAKAKGDKDAARTIALVDALVSMRDGKLDDAQKTLAAAEADDRIRIQLALLSLAQGKAGEAKPIVDQLLASQPDHEVARALSQKIDTAVAKTDPLPPEDGHQGSATRPTQNSGNPNPPQNPGPPTGGGGNDYDSLVARAGKLSESAGCAKALDLYSKALEQKPNGVEALSGKGYCFIDAKQYASAFSSFRAALLVSPRYEPALSGIAEAYQQQGRKQDAIDSWRKVLDAYPTSAKAKKQLELLGAGADNGGGGGGSAEAPPAPPPTPPPAPPPAPAGSADPAGQ